MSTRTLKVQNPPMRGKDVDQWRQTLIEIGESWGANDVPIRPSGPYDTATRAVTASVLRGLGIAQSEMERGVTPELRIKVRNRRLSAAEKKRRDERSDWRRRLVERWSTVRVSPPIARVLADSWGYNSGHDGLDLICAADAPIYAMVRSRVVRADTGGWWGLGAPADPEVRGRGDGIIVLEVLEDVGPFRRGMRIGYGHAEKPRVRVGQIVQAGHQIGHAGDANSWHIHLVVNDGDQGTRGVGRRDPRPLYDYARKHGSIR